MLLWNGIEFFDEPDRAKAEKLIKAGEAQDVSREDGLSLKYRHQFPQYQTRELRAEEPKTEPAPVEDAPVEAAEVNWENYKEAAKEALGKKRITQDQVEEWMQSEGII